MQKTVLGMPDFYESGIQSRDEFLYLREQDVTHREKLIAFLMVEFNYALVLHDPNSQSLLACADDQFCHCFMCLGPHRIGDGNSRRKRNPGLGSLLLLVAVLAKALFAFVGRDFMSFTFFTAGHSLMRLGLMIQY